MTTTAIGHAEKAEALSKTRQIFDRLFPAGTRRNFAVQLWAEEVIPASGGIDPAFTLVLTHPGALRSMFWPPGELTLAEAYLRGDFDVDGDIIATMAMAESFENLGPSQWLSLLWQVRGLPKSQPPERFESGRRQAQLSGRPHSQERDRNAVTYHYDTGNDFYSLFLGRWMAYSCAYFERPEADLDTAQAAKFEHICRKLRLQPGERLLDIGCGWGGLLVYAAQHYGVQATGINLSKPQINFAREWIERAGLSDRAKVELRDYRDVDPAQPFDKIVSVGMVEHVGRPKLGDYFQAAYRALRPGGLFLNHAIATHRQRPDSWFERTFLQRGQFVQRYVFPDGELVPISQMLVAAEQNGFEVRDVESLREHYALTLRHWVRNLEARHAEAAEMTDERTYRTWRLYMAASIRGFERAGINVYQALLSKGNAGLAELPLTRADLYSS